METKIWEKISQWKVTNSITCSNDQLRSKISFLMKRVLIAMTKLQWRLKTTTTRTLTISIRNWTKLLEMMEMIQKKLNTMFLQDLTLRLFTMARQMKLQVMMASGQRRWLKTQSLRSQRLTQPFTTKLLQLIQKKSNTAHSPMSVLKKHLVMTESGQRRWLKIPNLRSPKRTQLSTTSRIHLPPPTKRSSSFIRTIPTSDPRTKV